MAATGRSSRSVLRPLSSSAQRLHHHHHHHRQRSPSPCNLRLNFFSPGNIANNKPSSSSSVAVSSNHHQKRKCLCSPTTHPGSFRCSFHRRLEHDRSKTLASNSSPTKRTNSNRGDVRVCVGLNLRKLALINSLAKIGSAEAERFRTSLAANLVKPSSFHILRHPEFRPRLSRFYQLRTVQD
ncbi:hypothetical protein CARUB_v10002860mg [Capsella rubella]|uniref:Serine-rich protein-like protein n=1 Tax=Capsella rubella TaxID=81985 RepID=R0H7S7_9BRAS|nr:uncharacterized protein LOC17882996 [Capsella rubella]EOA19608.1 hypothetical protein CARUB_v10002860mg [Capsella rubella]